MSPDVRSIIEKYRARMTLLAATFEQQGYLYASSRRNPSYAILLTRNSSPDSVWRVTSFSDRDPIGHREYDMLQGGSPIQNAFAEFASEDMELRTRGRAANLSAPGPG
jgi:hypothetical protein